MGGAIAWSLPPLATRVAAKLFSLFSHVVQGEIPNRVVASKGKAASRGEREEREWISVLAGGTAGGTQLPPTYLLRGGNVLGDLRERGYVIRCSKAFNTQDGFRECVTQVLVPCLNASAACPVVVLL